MDEFADATASLIRSLGRGPAHFVGLSLGGMVGQELAASHPQVLRSLVIANSAAYYDEPARATWAVRVQTVRSRGLATIVEGALQRWFTPEFRATAVSTRVASLGATLALCDPEAYVRCCEAVAAIDYRSSNTRVSCPTLVVAGTRDEATPPSMSEAIRDAIQNADMELSDAAHLSAIERPAAFAAVVELFWHAQSARGSQLPSPARWRPIQPPYRRVQKN